MAQADSTTDELNDKSTIELIAKAKALIPDDHPNKVKICTEIDSQLHQLEEVADLAVDSDVRRVIIASICNFQRRPHRPPKQIFNLFNELIYHLSAEFKIKKKEKERVAAVVEASERRKLTGEMNPILSRRKRQAVVKKMADLSKRIHSLDSKHKKLLKRVIPDDEEEAEEFLAYWNKLEKDLLKAHTEYNSLLGNTISTSRMSTPFQLDTSTGHDCIDRGICDFITNFVNSPDHRKFKHSRPDFDALAEEVESIAKANNLSLEEDELVQITTSVNRQMILEYRKRMTSNLEDDLETYVSDHSQSDLDEDDPELQEKLEENFKTAKTEKQVLEEFMKKYESLSQQERQEDLEAAQLSTSDSGASKDDESEDDEEDDESESQSQSQNEHGNGDENKHETENIKADADADADTDSDADAGAQDAVQIDSGDEGDKSSDEEEDNDSEELVKKPSDENAQPSTNEVPLTGPKNPPAPVENVASDNSSQQTNKRIRNSVSPSTSGAPPIKVPKVVKDSSLGQSSSAPDPPNLNLSGGEGIDVVEVVRLTCSSKMDSPFEIIELSSDSDS